LKRDLPVSWNEATWWISSTPKKIGLSKRENDYVCEKGMVAYNEPQTWSGSEEKLGPAPKMES